MIARRAQFVLGGALALAFPVVGAQRADTTVAWRVGPDPIFRAGGADAMDSVAQFTRVTGAVRLSTGHVVVLHGDETRWFDPSGKYLRTSTRRGRGPGETQYATGIVRMPGDTVAIEQRRPLKRVLIGPDGKVARDEAADDAKFRGLRRWAECREYVLPDLSRVACERIDAVTSRAPDPGPGLLRNYTRFVRVSRGLDSAIALGRDIGIEQFGLNLGGRSTTFIVHPFHARSYLAAGGSPWRIVIATNPEYDVEVWRPDGQLERTLRRPNARRAPTVMEREGAIPALERRARNDRALADRIVASVPTPALLPAVTDLAVSDAGEILVGREGFLPSQPATIVDVFSRNGVYLGILRLPPRFRIHAVGADYVLGVRLDEDDVPSVEVLRLNKRP